MISKKILAIILAAAVVVSLGAVGAYVLLNDDPVELEYKDSFAVGDYQTYDGQLTYIDVIKITSVNGDSIVISMMGAETDVSYNELSYTFNALKEMFEDFSSTDSTIGNAVMNFSGSLLNSDGTLKSLSDIRAGDKLDIRGTFKATLEIEDVSSDPVRYKFKHDSEWYDYDESIEELTLDFDLGDLTKTGSEKVKTGLGDVECDVYKDDDGGKYYIHKGIVVKASMDIFMGASMSMVIENSTMLKVN